MVGCRVRPAHRMPPTHLRTRPGAGTSAHRYDGPAPSHGCLAPSQWDGLENEVAAQERDTCRNLDGPDLDGAGDILCPLLRKPATRRGRTDSAPNT